MTSSRISLLCSRSNHSALCVAGGHASLALKSHVANVPLLTAVDHPPLPLSTYAAGVRQCQVQATQLNRVAFKTFVVTEAYLSYIPSMS